MQVAPDITMIKGSVAGNAWILEEERGVTLIDAGGRGTERRIIECLRALGRQPEDISTILHLSAGITRRITRHWGEYSFRAAACTGALYHIELYLVCGQMAGLEAGVYHYGAHDFSLRQLREGDYRQALAEADKADALDVYRIGGTDLPRPAVPESNSTNSTGVR